MNFHERLRIDLSSKHLSDQGVHGALPQFFAYFITIASFVWLVLFVIVILMDSLLLRRKKKSNQIGPSFSH